MGRVANDKALAHAQAQRERILEAAYSRFVETGFHAAGMAAISEAADMSCGLIYRYFPAGKSAIIQAIIEEQLERAEAEIRLMQEIDLPAELIAKLDNPVVDRRRMNPALMLELSALASRDADIGSVVKRFDLRVRQALAEWLARVTTHSDGSALSPAEATVRATVIQLVFEGIVVRQAREPDVNRELLKRAVDQLLGGLMSPQPRPAATDAKQ